MLGFLKKFTKSTTAREPGKQVPGEEELTQWMREGFGLHQSGNLPEAEARYLKILEHRPQDADALFLLGQIRRLQEKPGEAIALTRQAIASNAGVSHFHYQLGAMLIGQEDWEAAAGSLRQALALDEASAETHNDLGIALNKLHLKEEAERHFLRALEINPELPQAHYSLGLKFLDEENLAGAETHFRKALESTPYHPDSLLFLGDLCRRSKRYEEAEKYLRAILDRQPGHTRALMGLGACFYAQGDYVKATMLYFDAVRNEPDSPQANYCLGLCYLKRNKFADAENYLQTAINLDENFWDAYANLGLVLCEQKRTDRVLELFCSVIQRAPVHPQLYLNYAFALSSEGESEKAIRIQKAALGSPDYDAEAYSNMAFFYSEIDEMDLAREWAEKSIELRPGYIDGHNNLAHALRCLGRIDEAFEVYEKSISLAPDLPDAHWGKSLALLSVGRFAEGWKEYEWRWRMKTIVPGKKLPGPEWDGEDISGKTLMLYQEQGLGDMIHFSRYIPMLQGRCEKIVLAMPRPLKRLLERIPGVSEVTSEGDTPPYDLALPLMSLPRVMGTTLETIPAEVPYLSIADKDMEKWQGRFAAQTPAFKVGLVWAGGAAFKGDRLRSMSLMKLAPLAEIRGIQLYSLQKGPRAGELKTTPEGMNIIDWTEDMHDFADTAAFIAHLDLVISVDTAVAHLAGALGKPVWTLIPMTSDFRWLLEREDSPWYPTMRLFRQKARGDWSETIRQVSAELGTLSLAARDKPQKLS